MKLYEPGSTWCARSALAASTLVLLALLAPTARADVVIFSNGDRWNGKVVSLSDGKLKFASDLAGEIVVQARRLQGIYTEQEVEVHTKDGTVVYEGLQPDAPGTVQTTGLVDEERVTIDIANIEAINPPVREAPGLSGRFVAGAEFDRGNSIKDAADLDARIEYESFRQRIRLRGQYEGERTTNVDTRVGTTNDRNLLGSLGYDYFIGQKWLLWTSTSAERDGPSDLNLRYILGGGPGYRFANRPDFRLTVRVGPAWISENFDDDARDEDKASVGLIWDMERKLGNVFTLFSDGTFAQSLESSEDALVRSEAGIRASVTRQIFLEGKVEWDWDSEPAEDAERQDVSYVFGVGYQF